MILFLFYFVLVYDWTTVVSIKVETKDFCIKTERKVSYKLRSHKVSPSGKGVYKLYGLG